MKNRQIPESGTQLKPYTDVLILTTGQIGTVTDYDSQTKLYEVRWVNSSGVVHYTEYPYDQLQEQFRLPF